MLSVQYLWEHGIQNIIVNGWGSQNRPICLYLRNYGSQWHYFVPPVHMCCQVKHCMSCRTTAEFASMTMAERMEVTELAREYWPGTIVNNISAASHVDALQYLHHSQTLVKDCQVTTMLKALTFVQL